jgi:ABC-type multidrug transport system fused ATPase/permease subunit
VLFFLLLLEGIVSTVAVLAMVPLATYLTDPDFSRSGRIASMCKDIIISIGLPSNFWTYGMIFVGFNAIKGVVDIAIRHATLRIKYAVVRNLLQDVLRVFFKARWEFFGSTNQGKLLSTLNKELDTIGSALGQMALMLAQVFQLAIYLVIPILLNPTLTATTCLFAVVFGLPFLLLQKSSYRLGKENVETASIAMGILTESLAAARIIIGFGRQSKARERYLESLDNHVSVTLKSQTLSHIVPNLYRPLGMLAGILAMGISIQRGDQVAELAAVMWSILSALPLLASIVQGNLSIKNFMPSYEQLLLLRSDAAKVEEVAGKLIFNRLENGICLKNVNFSYPGRSDTLKNININLRAGKMTALVGESGSGKSTVSDIILGLQIPSSGEILIDGTPLSNLDQNSFREKVGYVPQDPLLFQGSIKENLTWSKPDASDENIREALRLANAELFVEQLPHGIDTVVGDRGTKLSGGQRQRIALARALIRRPALLILDEATSALDAESERLIQEAIDRLALKTTILVIAHRLSTIAKADEIYVLQRGRIIQQGNFSALLRDCDSIFSNMVNAQRHNEFKTNQDRTSELRLGDPITS